MWQVRSLMLDERDNFFNALHRLWELPTSTGRERCVGGGCFEVVGWWQGRGNGRRRRRRRRRRRMKGWGGGEREKRAVFLLKCLLLGGPPLSWCIVCAVGNVYVLGHRYGPNYLDIHDLNNIHRQNGRARPWPAPGRRPCYHSWHFTPPPPVHLRALLSSAGA